MIRITADLIKSLNTEQTELPLPEVFGLKGKTLTVVRRPVEEGKST